MKYKWILFFILAFANKQSVAQNVTEQDYYDFFNSFINPDSIEAFVLSNKPDMQLILKDTAEIFKTSLLSSEDIEFMRKQIASAEKFNWSDRKILGAKIFSSKKIHKYFNTPHKDGWTEFYKHVHANRYYRYSIPLFSIDKTKCIVYRCYSCGWLCGQGGIDLYIKENGKWKWKEGYSFWIS